MSTPISCFTASENSPDSSDPIAKREAGLVPPFAKGGEGGFQNVTISAVFSASYSSSHLLVSLLLSRARPSGLA